MRIVAAEHFDPAAVVVAAAVAEPSVPGRGRLGWGR